MLLMTGVEQVRADVSKVNCEMICAECVCLECSHLKGKSTIAGAILAMLFVYPQLHVYHRLSSVRTTWWLCCALRAALHMACANGHTEVVRVLISAGAVSEFFICCRTGTR